MSPAFVAHSVMHGENMRPVVPCPAQLLRVVDSLQLAAKYPLATPVNWKQGEECMILPKVSDEEAKKMGSLRHWALGLGLVAALWSCPLVHIISPLVWLAPARVSCSVLV